MSVGGVNPKPPIFGFRGIIDAMKSKFLLTAFAASAALAVSAAAPKYVFLFIGDGMSTPQRMTADEFARASGHGHLVMNTFPHQATTRTCSASSLVTDSAAAATAIACGTKTYNGAIGVDTNKQPLVSSAYVAHAAGKKVGIVTTVTICHATPAGFYAHRPQRSMSYEIGVDLLNSGFEYFAGGGLDGQNNKTNSADYCGDLYKIAPEKGYRLVENKADFLALKPGCGKVWFKACPGYMQFSLDADGSEPTLAEMTAKGAELLDNPNGFFMMVEGGKIDGAGHGNDAAPNMRDVLALDEAVKVALKWMEQHPETLVIVTGDHETGGMTMGFAGTGYQFFMDRLARQKCSTGAFDGKLKQAAKAAEKGGGEFTFADATALLSAWYGFIFDESSKDPMAVTKAERAELEKAFKAKKLSDAARRLMSAKAGVGWTSGSHTSLPVLTTAKGLNAEVFSGFMENTDISLRLKAMYK